MTKRELHVIRPTGMSTHNNRSNSSFQKEAFQFYQGALCELIIFCQRIQKAVAAIRTEPNRISGKQIGVINKINKVSVAVPGNKYCLHLDIFDVEYFSVMKQFFRIIQLYNGKRTKPVQNSPAQLPRKIFIFLLPDVEPCLSEKPFAVLFHRSDMIRIQVCQQDIPNLRRLDIEPSHLLGQTFIIVTRINHNRRAVFSVKENISNPLTDRSDSFINPSGIQGFENLFPPKHKGHKDLLKRRIFF